MGSTSSGIHKAARIVVLSPARSVLLVRYHDPTPIDPARHEPQTYWVPPGGGVEEGESFEAAAIRELEEETGIELSKVGPQIWYRERRLMRHGELKQYQERYFLGQAEPARVLRNRTQEKIEAIRWWTLDELRASMETFFPEGFVELAASVIAGHVPVAPIDISRL